MHRVSNVDGLHTVFYHLSMQPVNTLAKLAETGRIKGCVNTIVHAVTGKYQVGVGHSEVRDHIVHIIGLPGNAVPKKHNPLYLR